MLTQKLNHILKLNISRAYQKKSLQLTLNDYIAKILTENVSRLYYF